MSKNEQHNIEFMEHILREWAENMWKNNNKDKITDKFGGSEQFSKKWYSGYKHTLTAGQRASEIGFVAYIRTAVYTVGFVSEKAVDALADNTLVNAWRKSVQKNNFQQRYNILEEILKETIDKHGKGGAAALFPEFGASGLRPENIAQALEYMNFTPKVMPLSDVAALIRVNNAPPAAAKPAASAPNPA